MMKPTDRDHHLEWLRQELRTTMNALNGLHHPVYPAPADRVQALESYVAELKESMRLRKEELRAQALVAEEAVADSTEGV